MLGVCFLRSEMNDGNIRLRMTLKINVGCLSLTSEMNDGNIRLRKTLKINVGCLSLASEMNGGNIRLLYDAKNECRVLVFSRDAVFPTFVGIPTYSDVPIFFFFFFFPPCM